MPRETVTREELIRRYCETQEATPEEITKRLTELETNFKPVSGFMLLQCEQFDSSRFGSQVILPYGPGCTFKDPPTHPISPRGLASDMSVVVAIAEAV
jgi:hypothetical protein